MPLIPNLSTCAVAKDTTVPQTQCYSVHCSYSPRPLTIFAEPVRVGLWPVAGGALEAEGPGDRAHDALPAALAPPAAVVSVARGAARVRPARHELVLLERGATGRYLGRGEEGREEEGEEEREGGQGRTHCR